MTRFARAKGSKSSNERAPEDSTPWEVMKEQLLQVKAQNEDAKKREEAENQRIKNYENFLKEHKSQKRKATWCDFPETEQIKQKQSGVDPSLKKKKKSKHSERHGSATQSQINETEASSGLSNTTSKKSKKTKLNKVPNALSSCINLINTQNSESKANEPTEDMLTNGSQKVKKIKKKKQKIQVFDEPSDTNQVQNSTPQEFPISIDTKKNGNKNTKKQKIQETSRQENYSNHISQNNKQNEVNFNQKKQKKVKKLLDGVPIRRKPINDRSFQLIINGKEVELLRFDGFPIMKKDAERLEELKNNMIKKGIPKSEVNRTLKLERRRAEKALARLKKDVCYNCRKGGHNLSDCPELKTKIPGVGAPDGVCFKCGSTEHRQFECKVQKDKEFRFATCFICKEPGHIARQCPDNPKGLYPNGGGCKLCGDVTHLRKDCPTAMGKKEETSIKLQTLDSTEHLEGIEQKTTIQQETVKKPKKITF